MANQPMTANAEDRFGVAMRLQREKRGWSQAELARQLAERGIDLHFSAIAKMELRDVERPRVIRLNEAVAIADVFGTKVDQMLATAETEFEHVAREFASWLSMLDMAEHRGSVAFERLKELAATYPELKGGEVNSQIQTLRDQIVAILSGVRDRDLSKTDRAEEWLQHLIDVESEDDEGDTSLEVRVERLWPRVLDSVLKRRRFSWMLLSSDVSISDVQDGSLSLTFKSQGARHSFLRGSKEILEEALAEVLGGTWQVTAVAVGFASEEEVRARWTDIMRVLKRRARFAWQLMERSARIAISDDGKIIVGFYNPQERHDFLNHECDEVLEEVLSEIFGGSWLVDASVIERPYDEPPF